jgi:archaeal flagellin FlaB
MNSFKGNDDGFTGLEAAIVLIAFVVVAAVFSYVVLGAGFFTTQKAQETVYKGVEQSTTNILIKGSVYGQELVSTTGIDTINFTLGLAPGAPTIDLTKMRIVYSTSTTAPVIMSYANGTTVDATNGLFDASKTSMGPDDQIEIGFMISPVGPSTIINIEIRPPGGGAAIPFTKTIPGTITKVNVLH